MKKRIMGLVGVSLIGAMLVTSLTGCGLQTKATDITVDDGDTIIVDQEDMETESKVETNTEETDADEIISTEVIGGDDEIATDFASAEDESIVLYAEIEKYPTLASLKDMDYKPANGTIATNEDIAVYNGDGFEVGYIKSGSVISVTEFGVNALARFKNPIEGSDYDYLYVLKDYVTDNSLITITTVDAEAAIKEELANRDYDAPVFISATDDMKMYEFRIPSTYKDSVTDGPSHEVSKYFIQINRNLSENERGISSYKTYAVVCTEDTDGYIICQIYCKDAFTDEELFSY